MKVHKKNIERSSWAMAALVTFQRVTGLSDDDGLDTAISDLLADIMHLCDVNGFEFDSDLLRIARGHYEWEKDHPND